MLRMTLIIREFYFDSSQKRGWSVILLQQDAYIADGSLLGSVDLAGRFQLEVTCVVSLTETNEVRNWVVHYVAELIVCVAFGPVLSVCTYVEVVLIDSTGQVFCCYRSIAETSDVFFLTLALSKGKTTMMY